MPQDTGAPPRPPHRRFLWSRQAQQDPQGFYYTPIGLCEDYPSETTTPEKVERDFRILREVGAKVFRFGISWNEIEGVEKQYRWHHWDQVFALAKRYGITALPYVCYTPNWLADSYRDPPEDLKRFGDFMYVIARRYRGQTLSWELWNEPDNDDFWRGEPYPYAGMARYAAGRVREADPNAVLVLGEWPQRPPS